MSDLIERGKSIIDRRDFTFAECALAEEVMDWVADAITVLGAMQDDLAYAAKLKDRCMDLWADAEGRVRHLTARLEMMEAGAK